MKNRKTIMSAAAALILLSSNVFAGQPDSTYGGIQFTIFNYSEDGISTDFRPKGLIVLVGKNINESFSIEGRLGKGVSDDTKSVAIFAMDGALEIDSLIGVYGIGHAMLNESSSVYGLIGFTRAEVSVSVPTMFSASINESSLSFGIGADIAINNDVAFNIEFIQYLSKSDLDLNAIGFGIKFGF